VRRREWGGFTAASDKGKLGGGGGVVVVLTKTKTMTLDVTVESRVHERTTKYSVQVPQ
jgi:hypothetical protein